MYRSINYFKKGYQPRANIVKDEKGDLFTDCHGNVARWSNHFSQPLNAHGVNNFRQTKIHTAEPLGPEPCALEFGMAIEKLNGVNSKVLIKYQQN